MKLFNQSKNQLLRTNLKVAESFKDRAIGMMGQSEFPEGYALWIKKCNWIHTYFMKTNIDVIFVDKNLKVTSAVWNMGKWKFSPFVWAADSVIEIPTGVINTEEVRIGDQLNVEP